MVKFMEVYPDFAKGINNVTQNKYNSDYLWTTLTSKLNALGPPEREHKSWKRVWKDYKHSVKRKIRLNRIASNGLSKISHFNSIENRVIQLMEFNLNRNVEGDDDDDDYDGDYTVIDDVVIKEKPSTSRRLNVKQPKQKVNLKTNLLEKQVNGQQNFYTNFNQKMDIIIGQNKEHYKYPRKLYELKKERLKMEDKQRAFKNKYLLSMLELKKRKQKIVNGNDPPKATTDNAEDKIDEDFNGATTTGDDKELLKDEQYNNKDENPDNDLESTTSSLSQNSTPMILDNDIDDEHTIFGKLIATQMRTLPLQSLFRCQISILEIIAKEKIKFEISDSSKQNDGTISPKCESNTSTTISVSQNEQQYVESPSPSYQQHSQPENSLLEEMITDIKEEYLDSDYE